MALSIQGTLVRKSTTSRNVNEDRPNLRPCRRRWIAQRSSDMPSTDRDQLRARRDSELAEDMREVRFHRSPGDEQAPSDVAVSQAIRDELHDRDLRRRQALPSGLWAAPRALPATRSAEGAQRSLDPSHIPRRTQPV